MHRADLVEMLAAALPPGVVHTGHRCSGFEQTGDVARVSFANGAVAEGDLVIAADGIHSELRQYVTPPSRPVFHGSVAYRGVIAHRAHSALANRLLADVARQGQALPDLSGARRRTHQLCRVRAGGPGDEGILVGARAIPKSFAGSSPAGIRASESLLSQVEATFRWALYDREPLPTWTQGRLTLLGDAAHPMLPHLGQGANQSIEDGMALATILARANARDSSRGAARL